MINEIAFLKRALNRGNNAGMFACYHVRDGQVWAQNERLQALVAYDSSENFSVSGTELEAAISRMEGQPLISVGEGMLYVRQGRLRASIPLVGGEPPQVFTRGVEWRPAPERLCEALTYATPFLSSSAIGWTAGMRLMNGRLTVVNNKMGIDIAIPGWESEPSLITKDCAEFIMEQGQPTDYAAKPGALLFRWGEDKSMQAQLIEQQMPAMVDNIFAQAGTDYPVELTDEWRAAYEDAEAMAESVVEVRPDVIAVGKGKSRITVDAECSATSVTFWETKVLTPMLSAATHWNPGAYPKPAAFKGPGLYGVVMGVKQ